MNVAPDIAYALSYARTTMIAMVEQWNTGGTGTHLPEELVVGRRYNISWWHEFCAEVAGRHEHRVGSPALAERVREDGVTTVLVFANGARIVVADVDDLELTEFEE